MSKSVVKWSEGSRNWVSIIIGRYTDRMKFYCFFHIILVLLCIIVYIVVCFGSIVYHFIYCCMFCTLQINFVYCAILLLCSCIFIVMSVPF